MFSKAIFGVESGIYQFHRPVSYFLPSDRGHYENLTNGLGTYKKIVGVFVKNEEVAIDHILASKGDCRIFLVAIVVISHLWTTLGMLKSRNDEIFG